MSEFEKVFGKVIYLDRNHIQLKVDPTFDENKICLQTTSAYFNYFSPSQLQDLAEACLEVVDWLEHKKGNAKKEEKFLPTIGALAQPEIKDVIILSDKNVQALSTRILNYARAGYEPCGGVSVSSFFHLDEEKDVFTYAVMMIRYKTNE